MDLREQFEYPLPVLNTDTEKIIVETSGSCKGLLVIRNSGGGLLSGRIMSRSGSLTFSPEQFEGNEVNIFYILNLDDYKPGDVIHTGAVIMSNGGEKVIPIVIKLIPPAIVTKEEFKITGLKDFLSYAKKYPVPARQLLMTQEFMIWLFGIGYEYMEVFEQLIKDPNKERALDHFFIVSKLKKKTTLTLLEKKAEFQIQPYEKEPIPGVIPVKKTTWGFVEAEIRIKHCAPWLKLVSDRLISSDFNEGDVALIRYYAEPALLQGSYGADTLLIGEELEVPISLKKNKLLVFSLSRETFGFDEEGVLTVFNNSGDDLLLEVLPSDSYVRFEGKKYMVGALAKIPFTIKVTGFQAAQFNFKKQPFVRTEIALKTVVRGQTFEKTLTLILGT